MLHYLMINYLMILQHVDLSFGAKSQSLFLALMKSFCKALLLGPGIALNYQLSPRISVYICCRLVEGGNCVSQSTRPS